MKNSILNLEGVQVLSRSEQKNVNGGLLESSSMNTWCARRSTNVIDLRPGGSSNTEAGFQNASGCWIYSGMSVFSTPNCPPGTSCYIINQTQFGGL